MHSLDTPPTELIQGYRWLVGQEGVRWLAAARDMSTNGAGVLQITRQLRRDLSPERVRLVLEQLELRRRARDKFPWAERMYFSRLGLEQATDAWVAAYKAARFPSGQPLADLCCGVGGDLMAMAKRGATGGVDRDPIAGLLAQANLRVCGGMAATVMTKDVEPTDLEGAAAWHIDPDRRPAGLRTTRVSLGDPGPEVLARLIERVPNAAIKLAPAADLEAACWSEAELEWIGRARQCRQLVAWFGQLAAHPGRRRATMLRAGAAAEEVEIAATFVGEPNIECPIAPKVGRYVFEADSAVLAAKLEGALAIEQGLWALAASLAYYTADHSLAHPALACFQVLEVMPFSERRLRQWLGERDIGRLEIKKRGVPIDPEKLRRQLRASGPDEATILMARIRGRVTAILAQRVAASSLPESSPTHSSTG